MFYIALVLFPLWWIAALWRVPKTRVVGGTDTEKAVPLDDPQVEFGALRCAFVYVCWWSLNDGWTDARSWRFRCRVMAAISLVTYVPFVVCVAIFA